ncbi:hypothetical protein [Thalassotalea fusca]
MFDLFKYELQRFQKYALIAFIGYVAILGYQISQKPLLNSTQTQEAILMLIAVIGGLLFGAGQMWLHKRKSYWTYLVHRPLSTSRIYHALAGAGALWTIVVCSVPFLLGTIAVDIFDRELVEARHYWYSLHIAAIALFGYLVGTYTLLNPSWGALFSTSALFLMLNHTPSSVSVTLLVDLVFVACAYYLSLGSFKVNLSTHFTKKRQLLIASVLMQPGLALLILFSQAVFYHIPLTIAGTHPDQLEKEQINGYLSQSWQWTASEMIQNVLGNNQSDLTEQQVTALSKQVELANSGRIKIEPHANQVDGQLFNKDKTYSLDDKANKTFWQFSHKEQVLIGRGFYNRAIKGVISKNRFIEGENALAQLADSEKFTQVPMLTANRFIQTSNTLYIVDFVGQYIEVKHQLIDPSEFYTNEVQLDAKNSLAILTTNKGLYFFDLNSIQQANSYSEPHLVVKNHRELFDPRYAQYYLLVDGILIKYVESHYFGFEQPGIGLVYAKYDGSTKVLDEMAFKAYRPLPIFIEDQLYWQSPIFMSVIYDYARSHLYPHLPNRYTTLENFDKRNRNATSVLYAWVATVIALVITLIVGRKVKLPTSTLIFWLVLVAICSLPGLASFLLLNRWRHQMFGDLFTVFRKKPQPAEIPVTA